MPLHRGAKPGSKAFGENIATEIEAGKPRAQAAAIAYAESRRKTDALKDQLRACADALDGCERRFDEWSNEARKAAAESRRKGGHGDPDWHREMAATSLKRAKNATSNSEATRHMNQHTLHARAAKTAANR